jgi:hypothetical protein
VNCTGNCPIIGREIAGVEGDALDEEETLSVFEDRSLSVDFLLSRTPRGFSGLNRVMLLYL